MERERKGSMGKSSPKSYVKILLNTDHTLFPLFIFRFLFSCQILTRHWRRTSSSFILASLPFFTYLQAMIMSINHHVSKHLFLFFIFPLFSNSLSNFHNSSYFQARLPTNEINFNLIKKKSSLPKYAEKFSAQTNKRRKIKKKKWTT